MRRLVTLLLPALLVAPLLLVPAAASSSSGDDAGNPWVVNHYTGSSFPTAAAGAGKGWTGQDWLYQ